MCEHHSIVSTHQNLVKNAVVTTKNECAGCIFYYVYQYDGDNDMGEKSNKQIDPLADLFSNVQLTGLSKPKNKRTTLEPLQIDLPIESTERNPSCNRKSRSLA